METTVVGLNLSDVVTGHPPALVSSRTTHLGLRFAEIAERSPRQIAIQSTPRRVTYAEVLTAACSVRDRLRSDSRFEIAARVALLLPNSLEYIASFYGVLLAGGIVVPLSPDIESGRLETILESTAATHLLTAPSVIARRSGFRGQLIQPFRPSEPSGIPINAPSVASEPELAELAAIFFTAGSSGTPKGVMLTHRNLISNALAIQQYQRLTAAERPLCMLPFYHAFGNSVLQSHLLTGARVVLDGNPLFPESIVTALQQHEATSLSGVPDLLRFVLDRTSLGRTPLPSLRYMAVAGGALSVAQCQQLAGRIAPAELFVMYGQTEATARLSYLPPERLTSHTGSIGRGLPGVELQIVDEYGRVLPPGETGELRARGPNVMQGYWRDPDGTREVLRNGWL
ncbi:MAG: long-chain fatty acid--CoA ligase, partial [Desulfobacterales bacterium]|nr:long-chain fatty acid--CoA ligase [Desulfobacterales bacterium]